MATAIGRIEEFSSATDEWLSYLERLEHYFGANKISGEVKKRCISVLYWEGYLRSVKSVGVTSETM